MFFLFFSSGTRTKVLGSAALARCPRCHNDVQPIHVRTQRYLSLFFIPLLRWHREELDACPVCGHAEPHRVSAPAPERGPVLVGA